MPRIAPIPWAPCGLGMTVGCATCHDHKFDPIPQKDFYALGAFFRNTTQKVMDGNVSDTPPVLVVPRAEDRAAWEQKNARLSALRAEMEQARETAAGDFARWLRERWRRTQGATAGKRRRRLRGRSRSARSSSKRPRATRSKRGRGRMPRSLSPSASVSGFRRRTRATPSPASRIRKEAIEAGRPTSAPAGRLPADRRQWRCHRNPRRARRVAQARHLE